MEEQCLSSINGFWHIFSPLRSLLSHKLLILYTNIHCPQNPSEGISTCTSPPSDPHSAGWFLPAVGNNTVSVQNNYLQPGCVCCGRSKTPSAVPDRLPFHTAEMPWGSGHFARNTLLLSGTASGSLPLRKFSAVSRTEICAREAGSHNQLSSVPVLWSTLSPVSGFPFHDPELWRSSVPHSGSR